MTWTVYEKTVTSSGWNKAVYTDHPDIDQKHMRIACASGVGAKIQAMPVNEDGKTLAEVRGGA